MQIYRDGINKDLCSEIYDWAQSYVLARDDMHPDGFPNPVVARTNYSWHESLMKEIPPVIIFDLTTILSKKVRQDLDRLGLIDDSYTDFVPMVFVWTPGSYIPVHNDGAAEDTRKVFTSYLNKDWSSEMGGLFCFTNKDTGQMETITPEQGILIYNDIDESHYTTPVEEGRFRYSIQIFSKKS